MSIDPDDHHLIRRRRDMRHETVRHLLTRAERTRTPLTMPEHLAAHDESFRDGALAMADAIRDELALHRRLEREQAEEALRRRVLVPFPIAGAEARFAHWPTTGVGLMPASPKNDADL